jgi:hypothetical protein
MSSARGARYLTLAGLAAAAAAAAHGGWAELSDPRWAGAAALGAAVAAMGLAQTGMVAAAARWAAAELEHGHASHSAPADYRPLTVIEAAVVLAASQACAHVALLLAGAPAHPGAGGALALHLALALAAALAVAAADRAVSAALRDVALAFGRLLELLTAVPAARYPRPATPPPRTLAARLPLGRAPPLTA